MSTPTSLHEAQAELEQARAAAARHDSETRVLYLDPRASDELIESRLPPARALARRLAQAEHLVRTLEG